MLSTPPRVPRLTLLWGGAGIVVATALPLLWEATISLGGALLWRPSYAWPQVALALSAVVLLGAFIVLSVGIGTESGIVGASRVGKFSLIAFPAATVVAYALDFSSLSLLSHLPRSVYDGTGQPDQHVLITVTRAYQGIAFLGVIGLVVGSIFVARAGIVRGVVRWGLLALALVTIVVDVAQQTPAIPALWLFRWGALAVPLIQLAVGVLFIVQARAERSAALARSVANAT